MPHRIGGSPDMDTGLYCLALVARFHAQPCDPSQLRHELGVTGELSSHDLLRAAKLVRLKAKTLKSSWNRLAQTPLPAIAQHKDGHYFLVGKIDADKVLIQDPLEGRPQSLPRDLFESMWSGQLILIKKFANVPGTTGKFDLSWFVPAIVRYRKLFGEVLLASFILQILALVSPLFFQAVVDKVLVHNSLSTLDVLCVGLLFVSAFEVVFGILRTYVFSHTTTRVDVELGARLYHHLLGLPLGYFINRPIGTIVARVHELDTVRNFITGTALTLSMDLLFGVVFLAIMYAYSPALFSIVAMSIPCYVILSLLVMPLMRRRLNEKFLLGAQNQAFLTESITAIDTVKSMAVEPQMRNRWNEQLAAYVEASFKVTQLGNISGQIASLINKLTMLLVLWFGSRLVMEQVLTIGALIAFNMFAGRVSGPILRLVQLWQDFQQAGIAVERLGDILNTPAEPGYNPSRAALPEISGIINFEQVTFRYASHLAPVLQEFNLQVRKGEIIGIVGPSGSGKSTVAKLVQRLYVPESGRVTVDGVDLSLVDPAWLRRQIGIVPQNCVLFSRSVRENIAISDPGMSMESVVKAAKLAGAHEFILQLPEGYDTQVVEQGANLSGGQKQRIAIARALLCNPRILIFDEATSALDRESEEHVTRQLPVICEGRTVLIIAHRESTLRVAHRLVHIGAKSYAENDIQPAPASCEHQPVLQV